MASLPDPRRRGAQPHLPQDQGESRIRSPQARGSTANGAAERGHHPPIPAGAGLNRLPIVSVSRHSADPRRRGAQPPVFVELASQPLRSPQARGSTGDRKSTRLNSSHVRISYAVFCLKKKTHHISSLFLYL